MSRVGRWKSRLGVHQLECRDVPSTTLLKDINSPTFFGSNPGAGIATGFGEFYFAATDADHGRELWVSDGTPGGTRIFADINPGSGSGNPSQITIASGVFAFTADGGTGHGTELWVNSFDGQGVHELLDLNPGAAGSSVSNLTPMFGDLYFTAFTAASGVELWKTNGTAAGTQMVKELVAGANATGPGQLTAINGTLYFVCADAAGGSELWKSDGTAAGTVRVKDIVAGAAGSSPDQLTAVGTKLYFTADDGATGRELWISDGTAAGTVRVADINAGAGSSTPINLTVSNGKLFFSATTASNGRELWKSDGTTFGTVSVADINAGAAGSNPGQLTDVNGTLFFTADDGTHGEELFKTDGTTGGTSLVREIRSGAFDSSPRFLTNVNGTLYFVPFIFNSLTTLWKSDGTEAGTTSVRSFINNDAIVYPIGSVAGTLFLNARGSDEQGSELWMTTSVRRADHIAIGAPAGQLPQVRLYNTANGAVDMNLMAYTPTFSGGVRVAVGDVTGDGVDDLVTAPGAGGGPHIRVFDGVTGTCRKEFFAYAPSFTGGVFVAVGDLNGDGYADIITGAGAGGGPHVKVFNGRSLELITEFFAFAPTFLGGVNVGAGDVNADGYSDLIFAAGPGGGPHVRVVSGKDNKTELKSFFAYDAGFKGGVNIAAGDVNGDGYVDLLVSQASAGRKIRGFSGKDNAMIVDTEVSAATSTLDGVRVASADLNHDGRAELIYATESESKLKIYSQLSAQAAFYSGYVTGDPSFLGGVFIGA